MGDVAWDATIEAYVVSGYDDIVAVTRQPTLFSSRSATGPVMARQLRETFATIMASEPDVAAVVADVSRHQPNGVLLNADPPVHSRQRALVNRAFSLRRVRAMEDDLVAVADGLIDALADPVDLVRDLAVPFPLTVIARALGVPVAHMDDFKRWSDDFVVAIGNHDLAPADLVAMLRSQAEFFAYFDTQITARGEAPRDDLITDIVTARIDGEELSRPEMLSMFSQFLVAGNETTTKLITSAVLRLARDPARAAALRADPDAVAPFVEEVLRLDAPVQGLFRTATADTTVGGVDIPAGAALWLQYAAGNRDAAHFDDPDAVCPGARGATPHLSFGNGEHFCLGASLARAEARVAIQRLLIRFGTITVPVADDELEYEPSYVLRGLRALPVQLA